MTHEDPVPVPDPTPDDAAGLALLRELIDRYGVEGLTQRLGSAIAAADDGRVVGTDVDEAASWLEREHGAVLAPLTEADPVVAIGETHSVGTSRSTSWSVLASVAASRSTSWSALASVAVGYGGHAHLNITASGTAEGVTTRVGDVGVGVDQVTAVVTNVQAMKEVPEMFLYLVGLYDLKDLDLEAVPLILLLALAIVVVRARMRQADGGDN